MTFCPHCDEVHDKGVDFCPRTGQPIVDVVDRMVGRTIAGKYKLIRCIGQGGMGTIFEAEHVLIGNSVAVKMLHQPFAQKREPVQRLYREAKATGAVGHPNIIKVHDVGETADGIPFLVMELLEGESLGNHIDNNGPSPIGFVLEVSIQLLSALHAAHRAGIIHRDLKSDNIFLLNKNSGEISTKILDFGISKFILPEMENLKLTQTGSVLGTPYYMSPEQASGKKDLDLRIDIYSMGVIIYECLMGKIPHTASNYNALLIQIISQDVKPFRTIRPDVPRELEAAVLKAMSRHREDRWDSSLDMMDELVVIRDSLSPQVLSAEPVIQWDLPTVDRDSRTVDIKDVSFGDIDATPLQYETGIRTGFGPLGRISRKKLAAWIGASFGLIAGVAIAFIWIFAAPDATPGTGHVIHGETPPVTVDRVHADASPMVDAHVPIVKVVRLVVKRIPKEAVVRVDGREVPVNGLDVQKGVEPLQVVVSAEGFETEELQVIPSEDVTLEIELTEIKPAKGKKGGWKKGKKGGKSEDPVESTPDKPDKPDKPKSIEHPMDNPF
jgi:serine/threonine protein kinase